MKILLTTIASALLLAQPLLAQEPLPSEAVLDPEAGLIPEEVPQNPKPRGSAVAPQAGGFRKSKTDVSAEELKERIRFREAKTKALRDPQVQAEWERAEAAKTEYEKREALKAYYKLLYARMAKTDGSIKKLIGDRERISLRRLEQTRIDPTVPFAGE